MQIRISPSCHVKTTEFLLEIKPNEPTDKIPATRSSKDFVLGKNMFDNAGSKNKEKRKCHQAYKNYIRSNFSQIEFDAGGMRGTNSLFCFVRKAFFLPI
jgi:hypothetical protein